MPLTFDEWMRREQEYAKQEQDAVRAGDFRAASMMHNKRWQCIDAAGATVGQDSKIIILKNS